MNKTIEFIKVFIIENDDKFFCTINGSAHLVCRHMPSLHCETCMFNRDPIQTMTDELVTDYESKTTELNPVSK